MSIEGLPSPRRVRSGLAACIVAASLAVAGTAAPALAQSVPVDDETLADRPIARVVVKGLERVAEREVLNNLRVAAGQPFESRAVRDDVAILYRLGQFGTVEASALVLPDGSVELTYTVAEQPIVRDLQIVGNRLVSDQELRKSIPLYAGGPRDDFLLEQAVGRIKELYRKRGNYLAEVTVDETRLRDTGILILRIVEGPRVKVKEIEFVGNASFDADALAAEVATRTAVPLFNKGELDEERLVDDVAKLDRFYRDRGFVDVRVDRRVEISADSKEAKVVFVVSEGRRYRLRSVVVEGLGAEGPRPLAVFDERQVQDLLAIHRGDLYSRTRIDRSIAAVREAYYLLGHVDVQVADRTVRVGEEPEVDLVLSIRENARTVAGVVGIQGNFLTKDKVIRRLLRIQPGRVLDGRQIEEGRRRIQQAQLFGDVRVTVQRPDPDEQDALDTGATAEEAIAAERTALVRTEVRDILAEIKERNTGSVNFGVGLGTDSGIFGEFSVTQRNFDIADPPETLDELLAARAFRGAGQQFALSIAPGNEVTNLALDFTEPHLLETDLALRVAPFYRIRLYQGFDELRGSVPLTLTRRLGDFWAVGATASASWVELDNFDPDAPIEVYDSRGPTSMVSVGAFLRRNDADRQFRPTRGSAFELSATQTVPFENFDPYTTFRAGYTQYFTVAEDFLGRRSTLRFNADVGYILGDDVPTYDRFYLGGRTFRGFQFRSVSPKSRGAIDPTQSAADEPIGGDWLLFAGLQYEQPLVQSSFSGVVFLDSGTVTDEIGLDAYRASVGFGVRLYLPQLGPAPLAFDFAIPFLKEDGDETQVFSFSAEIPF
jgi:outer membrane protein insertion porin family